MTTPTFYVIVHVPTGKMLPQVPGLKGYTWVEPEDPQIALPRMLTSKETAKRALRAWLAGQWLRNQDLKNCIFNQKGPDSRIQPVASRNPAEFEIQKWSLTPVVEHKPNCPLSMPCECS